MFNIFKSWAKTNKNFSLLGRLVANVADAHTAGTYYHRKCYVRLRDSARATERRELTGPVPPPFDPIISAQIVAMIEHSSSQSYVRCIKS
jgi:hypothetical protein